ncbi:DNA replication/repair protein RecF [Flavihumibacter petaseus]|uniref:DNA replication and repair protein RecF n=1 Tax=Flavihumibacter petaseus NBRC 106054 TaxID=1220578 RepID=A0A0E9N7F9_9BACT|nr:DNA replication and repair protein RecF [Flavihumibacter petaseus]GAO45641.1 DNA replication and repair protein RecF [Flavihumibacter petaseus NBRC 106054]
MLSIQSISVFQYKNYGNQSWDFKEKIVGISGRNGIGKTNLLDAVYYCCFTKSYFAKSDTQLVTHGAQGLRVAAEFLRNGSPYSVTAIIRENGKKEFRVNDTLCEKMADHIGQLPAVMVAPDDVQIITDGSEERRRFMDSLFSQFDHHYLLQLMAYNRLLLQRNGLLRQLSENGRKGLDLLDVIDAQLLAPAQYVHNQRKTYLAQLIEIIKKQYAGIAGEDYFPDLSYESPLLEDSLAKWLEKNRDKDIFAQRTTTGLHRDDLAIKLDDKLFRLTASQGQRKSLLFALKLAAFEMLKNFKGFAPLLLLDDVFEKLDETRMQNLLTEVCVRNDGQVFLTDTHPERIKKSLERLHSGFQLLELGKG